MKTTQTIHTAADLTGLAARIDRFLPQTQCAECGEPSCRAYAEAVAAGDADIDRCRRGDCGGVISFARPASGRFTVADIAEVADNN